MTDTTIRTKRLLLKSVTPALIHEQFNTKTKAEIMIFFGLDETSYLHYKSMHEGTMETFRISQFFFLIHDKETNQPIGECGYHTWNKSHCRAELFYSLKKDSYKQKGLMTENLVEVLDFGFSKMKLHRIEALVANWNTPSIKLLQRYGFTKEGTMREDYVVDGKHEDSDCYSLLKWEWAKINSK
ncbi:GNAT family N-acetyltransferase [Mangrovimonas aestuarii]|uniref:GNAT family N-acetyltransferase n=1 Tax=Mangrovimonas aestuarii TaxID=3018443 RepID=UPI0023791EA5|nr:GNAT family protein [Mangrovimonas aestuarii]